jgi:hypothetical protein
MPLADNTSQQEESFLHGSTTTLNNTHLTKHFTIDSGTRIV